MMIVVHFKWFNENNVFIEPKVRISDYDLDGADIRVKYKNFDYILCEKCNKKYHYNYYDECFDKEIRELKELFSKLQDYENFYFKEYLNKLYNNLKTQNIMESDIIEKKRMEFGKCKECLKIHKNMDENQNIVRKYGLLEWIPYDKFINIEFIGKRGLAKVYPAIWIDESIIKVESIL
ncbi:hypothetical protein RhiirC2_782458 [Rhizophagus irregularis]|uniref:Uncharacterized protein n=1 Tax=Rhizophagus irregularis TaxID=588596 RepID=A0A2N1N312_9GLOM|nr:hypothetical protein RhiirC2_782458 [Rhizophagus irregularis]